MIVIDYSSLAVVAVTGNLSKSELSGKEDALPLIRHVILDSILQTKHKHKQKFGSEVVIAIDNKKNGYWRTRLNKYYKLNRKEKNQKSDIDWGYVFNSISTVKKELVEHFPYKVIEVEGAEADDVVAVLCRYVHDHKTVREGVTEAPEPFLIVSKDGDFAQLHKYQNTEQYSPQEKKMITTKSLKEVHDALLTKIIKGDSGDGICNILSPVNSLVDKIKQNSVSTKNFLIPLLENDDHSWLTEEQKERMSLNRKLIDFDYIPEDIQTNILNAYHNVEVNGNKNKVFNYLIQNKMKVLFARVDEF